MKTMTAEQHAQRAAELLDAVEALQDKMTERAKDPLLMMQDSVNGTAARLNRDQEWTVSLATAHALVCLALLQVERI